MSLKIPASPRWGTTTKLLVSLTGLVLVGALLVRFRGIFPPLVVAAILTYLVLPIVSWIHRRAGLSWAFSTNVFFLALLLELIAGLAAAGLAGIQQLQGLFLTVQDFLISLPDQIAALSRQPLLLGPFVIDLSSLDLTPWVDQALASIQPLLGRVSGLLTFLATGAISLLAHLVLVLAVSYFLTLDYRRIRTGWARLSVPGAEEDLRRLQQALARIWHSFLRGQLLVVVTTGILIGSMMAVLGVRYSLALGVLFGIAKFVPIIGPFSAGVVAALVALFQPTNWLGFSPLGHAIVVVITVVILDQGIDYLLLPRIMGSSLNLHPVLVIVGAIVGASLAGVIGLLLSAPATATLLLLTRYAYRKLVDLSPWDPPIDAAPPARLIRWPWRRRARRRREGHPTQKRAEPADPREDIAEGGHPPKAHVSQE
jgi:predicted PurR-regulated permease PerM